MLAEEGVDPSPWQEGGPALVALWSGEERAGWWQEEQPGVCDDSAVMCGGEAQPSLS